MSSRGVLDALLASMGSNGVDHIQSTDGDVTPPGGTDEWYAVVPADGTTPTINRPNTEVSTGDKPVDGETVPASGLYFPFTQINLSNGEVYALRN